MIKYYENELEIYFYKDINKWKAIAEELAKKLSDKAYFLFKPEDLINIVAKK